jgi:hypothetical protein
MIEKLNLSKNILIFERGIGQTFTQRREREEKGKEERKRKRQEERNRSAREKQEVK